MGRVLLDAVEAIYSGLEVERPGHWLARILPSLVSCVGWHQGGYAHAYDLRGPVDRWALSVPVTYALDPAVSSTVMRCFEASPPDVSRKLFLTGGPAGTFSAHAGVTFDQMPGEGGMSIQAGVRDCAFINAINPAGDGVLFCITASERRQLPAPHRRRLAMVSAHVAAAHRLLRALAKGGLEPAAVFEADGRVAHVERAHEGALSSLRRRVRDIDRARSRRRGTTEEALSAWQALLRGEYSTVDRFESDGRRYVVAFANAPAVLDPRGLSPQESAVASWAARGHPEKLIAYELGLAQGTVSTLLSRAYRKLGVRSRVEFVQRMEAPTELERLSLDDGAEVLLFSAPNPDHSSLRSLTVAEREIALAAASGQDNRTIAARRGVSVATVGKQLASAYTKLCLRSRADLAGLLCGAERAPSDEERQSGGARLAP